MAYLEAEGFPEVVALQETKLTDIAEGEVPDGYTALWHNCTASRGYSGVGFLVLHPPLSVMWGFEDLCDDVSEYNKEGRLLTLRYARFWVVTAYVPFIGKELKRKNYRERWDTLMMHHLARLGEVAPVIWLGDLNVAHHDIDIYDPVAMAGEGGFTIEERQRFGEALSTGLTDVWRALHPGRQRFTFWPFPLYNKSRNDGWRLDYCVCTTAFFESAVLNCVIRRPVRGSDHCPLVTLIGLHADPLCTTDWTLHLTGELQYCAGMQFDASSGAGCTTVPEDLEAATTTTSTPDQVRGLEATTAVEPSDGAAVRGTMVAATRFEASHSGGEWSDGSESDGVLRRGGSYEDF